MATRVARKTSPAASHALYLYGLTPKAFPPPAVPGVDGAAPVEPLPVGAVIAWISRVPSAEYADRLTANMEDLEWLAAAGVRHQRVVAELAQRADILPARFGTVFLTPASLLADIGRNKRELLRAFKRVAGCDEWGVKIFAEPRPRPAAVAAASGRDYLRKKAAALASSARRALDPDIKTFGAALARLARDTTAGGKVSAGQRDLEWQASFLLPRGKRRAWQAVLDRYAARWRGLHRIECTGPWPPYSFVTAHGR